VTTARLKAYADMIRASDRAWPDRIDAIAAADYAPPFFPRGRASTFMRSFVENTAERLALLRVARIAVAVERYEREHGEQQPATLDVLIPTYLPMPPVDPFSGRPVRLLSDSRGYTVYSVGRNRHDDGGHDVGQPFGSIARPRASLGADLGIRIERH
jgi:hypothetical protein